VIGLLNQRDPCRFLTSHSIQFSAKKTAGAGKAWSHVRVALLTGDDQLLSGEFWRRFLNCTTSLASDGTAAILQHLAAAVSDILRLVGRVNWPMPSRAGRSYRTPPCPPGSHPRTGDASPAAWQSLGGPVTQTASKMTNCWPHAAPIRPDDSSQAISRLRCGSGFYLLFTYKTVLSVETSAETRQDRLWDAYLYMEDVNGRCYSPLGCIFIAIFAHVFVSDIAEKIRVVSILFCLDKAG